MNVLGESHFPNTDSLYQWHTVYNVAKIIFPAHITSLTQILPSQLHQLNLLGALLLKIPLWHSSLFIVECPATNITIWVL